MNLTVAQLETQTELDEWHLRGQEIVASVSNAAWDIGDWINSAKHTWGDYYKTAVEITGMATKTLQNYGYVAKRFPFRKGELSFQHYNLVAWIPPDAAQQWLELAAAQEWSVRDLQSALRVVKQLPPGQPEIVASIFKIVVPHDHEQRWRAAAQARGLEISDWLILVADEAAA